jgi:hypothetical protein
MWITRFLLRMSYWACLPVVLCFGLLIAVIAWAGCGVVDICNFLAERIDREGEP